MTPYNFTQRNELSFEFTTDQGIVYTALFFDYEYLFGDYPEISKYIYSFTLDIVKGENANHLLDDKIGETVVSIFKRFFESKDNVVVYMFATVLTNAILQGKENLIGGFGNITMEVC